MAAEWSEMTLRTVGVRLLDCEHRTPPPAPSGYPYIAIPQIRDGRLDLSDVRHITQNHYVDWTRKTCPQANDVIVVRRCNPGDTAFVPPGLECALGQNLVLLRADGTKVLPEFLRWLARSPAWWEQIQTYLNVGAVFDSLRCQDIPNFTLPIPPLAEQRAIASILGSLDDKIELNRRMNETLESVARALFKSWFVDFDPVRAKARGRHPTGVDMETAEVFADRFVDSELGGIPSGWRVGSFADVASNVRRGAQPDEIPAHTPYVALEHMPRRCIALSDWSDASEIESNKSWFDRGSILFGKLRPYFHKVVIAPTAGVCSTDILVIEPTAPEWFGFVLGHASSDEMIQHADRGSGGTKMPRTNWGDIGRFALALPPAAIAVALTRLTRPLVARIESNVNEAHTLAALRDALLPKLLSGAIRVKNACRFLDGVNA